MKKIIFAIAVVIFLASAGIEREVAIIDDNELPSVSEKAFKPGEKLEYEASYGFVTGGKATLEVMPQYKKVQGRTCYHIVASGRTVGMVDWVYGVRDTYESYVDTKTMLPQKHIRNIKESDYRYYDEMYFDHEKDVVLSQKKGEVKVPDNIQDILSAFYYARSDAFHKARKGDTIKIQTFFEGKLFPLIVLYHGKYIIKTPLGKIKVLKLTPLVEEGRVFESKDDVSIYISADKNHVPVRIESKLVVGSVKFDLKEYKGLKHDLAFVK